jgi:hypothetical protein
MHEIEYISPEVGQLTPSVEQFADGLETLADLFDKGELRAAATPPGGLPRCLAAAFKQTKRPALR